MSKIVSLRLANFKAVDKFEADFNGCTAIITAGNDKGKTSFLRGIIDRIQFIRPDVKVRKGETKGSGTLMLDTGERFEWEFDIQGKDKLVYIDAEGIKQNLTVELGKKFFPPSFDIDKFLQSPPKSQAAQLQKIVGIDFTDVDERFAKAYANRTARNAEAEKFHVKLSKMLEVPYVAPVDLTELLTKKEEVRAVLNAQYKENREKNAKARAAWEQAKKVIDDETYAYNKQNAENRVIYNTVSDALTVLRGAGYHGDEVTVFMQTVKDRIQSDKRASDLYPPEPKYIEEMPDDAALRAIDEKIVAASETNTKAKAYADYIDYKQQTEDAKVAAEKADEEVKAIEAERRQMIMSANFPPGVVVAPQGHIEVDGLPLDKTQISTSKLYTTALHIASMCMGEVKTLYFDASYLDNKNLNDICQWADSRGFQLLIERPDRDGGEIRYEIIEG